MKMKPVAAEPVPIEHVHTIHRSIVLTHCLGCGVYELVYTVSNTNFRNCMHPCIWNDWKMWGFKPHEYHLFVTLTIVAITFRKRCRRKGPTFDILLLLQLQTYIGDNLCLEFKKELAKRAENNHNCNFHCFYRNSSAFEVSHCVFTQVRQAGFSDTEAII